MGENLKTSSRRNGVRILCAERMNILPFLAAAENFLGLRKKKRVCLPHRMVTTKRRGRGVLLLKILQTKFQIPNQKYSPLFVKHLDPIIYLLKPLCPFLFCVSLFQ